jgi:mono/diheme cytochrome c family protein
MCGAAGLILLAGLIAACGQPPADVPTEVVAAPPAQTALERGELLVTIGGCGDCHTPKVFGPNGPEPDTTRMLAGHPEEVPVSAPFSPASGSSWTIATNDHLTAWSGPWGVSFAANLTPDDLTGLRSGVWTKDLFIEAMRTGKHMATARVILPPMPWQVLGQLSDDDLKAIWAYLGSMPAVLNHVPDPVPPLAAAAP